MSTQDKLADALREITAFAQVMKPAPFGTIANAIAALAEHAAQPAPAPVQVDKRDREADRARFPDAQFNVWLDEGISDCGHTVWDAIGDVCDAWHGWKARQFYAHPQPPSIPEPSDADVVAACNAMCAVTGTVPLLDDVATRRMRAALTTARARLLERIGQAPGGDGDA